MTERTPHIPQAWNSFSARDVARLNQKNQVRFDQHITPAQLRMGRDLILATNIRPPAVEGEERRPPLAYVAEDAERMFHGKDILVVSYSGVNYPFGFPHHPETGKDFDASAERTIEALQQFGPNNYIILHRQEDPAMAVADAQAFFVAGGNSSGHSANLHGLTNFDKSSVTIQKGSNTRPLHRLIRKKVADSTPYLGVSAGQMVATGNTAPHIDAPSIIQITLNQWGEPQIVMPYNGLNLVGNFGLAVHPHYHADRLTNYGDDETQRIRAVQIIEGNPWMTILGMEDNTALKVVADRMTLVGDPDAKAYIMTMDREAGEVSNHVVNVGDDLSYLLDTDANLPLAERIKRNF